MAEMLFYRVVATLTDWGMDPVLTCPTAASMASSRRFRKAEDRIRDTAMDATLYLLVREQREPAST